VLSRSSQSYLESSCLIKKEENKQHTGSNWNSLYILARVHIAYIHQFHCSKIIQNNDSLFVLKCLFVCLFVCLFKCEPTILEAHTHFYGEELESTLNQTILITLGFFFE
jgi:hypothetical protein